MSTPSLRIPENPLLNFHLDSSSLRRVLEYLLETAETTKQSLAEFRENYDKDMAEVRTELARVPKMESDLAFCVTTCGNIQKLDDRVRSWGTKFLEMQEDQAKTKIATQQKVEQLSNQMTTMIKTGLEGVSAEIIDVSSRLTVFEQKEPIHRKEAMDTLKQELSEKFHSLTQTLAGQPEDLEEMEMRSRRSSMLEMVSGDLGVLKEVKKYQNLHLRVLNLERRMASLGEGTATRRRSSVLSNPFDPQTAEQLEDAKDELHLKFVTILNEANILKELFKKIGDREDTLADIEIPNFANYVPYHKRIQMLEEKSIIYARQTDFESLAREVAGIKTHPRAEMALHRSETKNFAYADNVAAQIADLKVAVEELREGAKQLERSQSLAIDAKGELAKGNTAGRVEESSAQSVEKAIEALQQAVKTVQKNLAQRVTHSELESLMKTRQPPVIREESSKVDLSEMKEKFEATESKLNYYWEELNRVKTSVGEKAKAVDRFDSQLSQSNAAMESNLQRLRIELKSQIGDIHTLLDKQSDDPDTMKNIVSLKVVVMKLQKELRELTASVDGLPRSEAQPIAAGETDGQAEEDGGMASRGVVSTVRRHELELKHAIQQLAAMATELNEMRVAGKKQAESANSAYLKHLEEMKGDMDSILARVNDGAKLNQRDFEKIAELFEIVGAKGDRADLESKAGKEDLRRASHILAHRIEELRFFVKKLENMKEEARKAEEAFLTKKKFDFECLSCGRGTSPAPPFKESTAKDAIIPAFKVGPGFSRLLNFLQTVANNPEDNKHARARSEVSDSQTDRLAKESANGRKQLGSSQVKLVLPKVANTKSQRETPVHNPGKNWS